MKSSGPPLIFGEWIKQRRKLLDLTQDELARKTGCSVFALRKIESGERRPSKQLAELLADSLEVPAAEKPVFIRTARGEVNLERLPLPTSTLPPASDQPAVLVKENQPSNFYSKIPVQMTPLFGRDVELAAMEKILRSDQCRLLTLTGMGGIGKTRLAVEFAVRSCSHCVVFFVPLTPVNQPEKIISTIAEILDYRFSGPAEPKEQLINFISTHIKGEVLFILDNLEHLLVHSPKQFSVVELINELIQKIPDLKIMGTSRERLNLYGEWEYELYGLSVPPNNFVGKVEDYESVALFINRAQMVYAGFQIPPEEQTALIQICQLVEGVPLAVELAAAWAGMLSCSEIANEIKTNIDFLATSMRDVPERHRSIRATFDHSWKLLTDIEQKVLSQLSVFNGGFNRDSAQQIAGASLDILAALSKKSLIHRLNNGRYDLHQVISQCALSHLQNRPDRKETYERHCRYYFDYFHEREKWLKSSKQQEAISQLLEEIGNMHAAWDWAIRHKKFSEIGKCVRSFGWYFEITGLYQEGIKQLEILYSQLKEEPDIEKWNWLVAIILNHQALLYLRKGEIIHSRKLYEESTALLRKTGDSRLLADALAFLSITYYLTGDLDGARQLVDEALGCARTASDAWLEAFATFNSGYLCSMMGRPEEGYEEMFFGLMLWRKVGDPHAISMGLNYFAPILIQLGRFSEAKSYLLESLTLCEQSKNQWGMGTAYRVLGLSMLSEGYIDEAKANLIKSLELFSENIAGWDVARTLSYLGDAAVAGGDFTQALNIYLDALRVSIDTSTPLISLDILLGLAKIYINTGKVLTGKSLSEFVLDQSAAQETKERARILIAEAMDLLTDSQDEADNPWHEGKSIERIFEEILKKSEDGL